MLVAKSDIKKWNKILADKGLSMSRGSQPNKLIYCGTQRDLAQLESIRVQKEMGKKPGIRKNFSR